MSAVEQLDFAPPKYRLGQRVFHASEVSSAAKHPCPDCLGTQAWKIVTPAGMELEASCQRCGSYTSNDIPSLTYQTWVASVRPLTIGSVRIDTAAGRHGWNDEPISYMCVETGVGGGSVYYQGTLFATEEEAQVAAEAKALARRITAEETPKRLEGKRFAHLVFKDAHFEVCRSAIWGAWYCYRRFREEIEEFLADESLSGSELRESIEGAHKWEVSHRDIPSFEELVAAASKSDDPAIKAALEKLQFKALEQPHAE